MYQNNIFYEFQINIDPQSKHIFMSTNIGPKYTSLYRYRFNSGFRPTDDYSRQNEP